MKPYLLDVNLLIALSWPSHVHYAAAQEWFSRKRKAGFATCPVTQLGFVRISSNPSYVDEAVLPEEAAELLRRITRLPGHRFWPDELNVQQIFTAFHTPPATTLIVGHRQVTDAYLAQLARARGGRLATFDRAMAKLHSDVAELVPD